MLCYNALLALFSLADLNLLPVQTKQGCSTRSQRQRECTKANENCFIVVIRALRVPCLDALPTATSDHHVSVPTHQVHRSCTLIGQPYMYCR